MILLCWAAELIKSTTLIPLCVVMVASGGEFSSTISPGGKTMEAIFLEL